MGIPLRFLLTSTPAHPPGHRFYRDSHILYIYIYQVGSFEGHLVSEPNKTPPKRPP